MRLVLIVTLLVAAVAQAANPKASALAKDADRLYKDGRYQEAAQTLAQAFAADPNPLYLWNIARAWDQAGEAQKALDGYREYVSQPSDQTQPDLVKKANLNMDRLRTVLAKESAEQTARQSEKQRLEAEAEAARRRADDEAARAKRQKAAFDEQERARKEQSEQKASTRTVAALAVGGVGVVGVGLWAGLGLAATGARKSFTQATTVAQKQAAQSSTVTLSAVADVSLVVGLAAAVTAVILWPKGSAEPTSSVSVSLAPVPGGAMAGVAGEF